MRDILTAHSLVQDSRVYQI